MKKKLAVLLGVTIVGSALLYLVNYGFSSTSGCAYTEEEIVLPQELQGVTLVGEKFASIYTGEDGEGLACTKTLGAVQAFIINGPNAAAALSYGAKEQKSIDGMRFTLKQIISTTKHGIGTVDSGSGPTNWLILEDEFGAKYRLATVYLGLDARRSFLGAWKDNERKGALIYGGYSDIVSIATGQEK